MNVEYDAADCRFAQQCPTLAGLDNIDALITETGKEDL